LQLFLDNQAKLNYETKVSREGFENFFTDYHSYEDITAHLDELASQYKKLVKKIKIGTTSEGRPIYAWRLHKKAKKSKPTKTPTKKTHGKNLLSSWLEDLGDNINEWFESAVDIFNTPDEDEDLYEDEEDDYQVTKKKNKDKKPKKPMEIVINGGQHGREWISPVSCRRVMR
jgi:Zinc carboxypeptidase